VQSGAREVLLRHEREKFLKEEWPRVLAQIKALGLDLETLLNEGKPS
jgi:GntR family transcriptional regulator